MSGIVDELGPEVTGIKKGDRVAGVFFLPPNLIYKCSYFYRSLVTNVYHTNTYNKNKTLVEYYLAGILPLDSEYTGCTKYCLMEEYNLGNRLKIYTQKSKNKIKTKDILI